MTNLRILEYALVSYIDNLQADISTLNEMKNDGLDTSSLIESKIKQINQARLIYNHLTEHYIEEDSRSLPND